MLVILLVYGCLIYVTFELVWIVAMLCGACVLFAAFVLLDTSFVTLIVLFFFAVRFGFVLDLVFPVYALRLLLYFVMVDLIAFC